MMVYNSSKPIFSGKPKPAQVVKALVQAGADINEEDEVDPGGEIPPDDCGEMEPSGKSSP